MMTTHSGFWNSFGFQRIMAKAATAGVPVSCADQFALELGETTD
jgi:hypothetical protein